MAWDEVLTGHAIALALIVVGFLLTAVGQKFFSGFIGIAGALSFGFLGAYLGHTYLYQFQWWLWILTCVLGALGGFLLFIFLRLVALMFVSFGSGILVGLLLTKVIEASTNGFGGHNLWFQNNGWILVSLLFAVVLAGIAVFQETIMLLFSTSVLGAWCTILGIDHFIKNSEFTLSLVKRNHTFECSTVCIALLSTWLALTLVGFIVQTVLWFMFRKTEKDVEGTELYEPLDLEDRSTVVSGISKASSSRANASNRSTTINHHEEPSKWNPRNWFKKNSAEGPSGQHSSEVDRIRAKYQLTGEENEKARQKVRAKYGL